jgi:hypothetical protein
MVLGDSFPSDIVATTVFRAALLISDTGVSPIWGFNQLRKQPSQSSSVETASRLPGAGYAALHPELADVNPEDYPDIHKLAILADVAPYSREYNTYRQKIGRQAQGNTELEIEYEKILARVKKTRESVIRMTDRDYTEPVDEISGTVESASPGGITLKEFPGRTFQFSSVSTSAADMSARILGEKNDMTRCRRPAGNTTPRARARSFQPLRIAAPPAKAAT